MEIRRFIAILALSVFVSSVYFYHPSDPNIDSRLDTLRAITEEGHFYIDSFKENTRDTISWNGHIYSNKAPNFTLLALPIYFMISKFAQPNLAFRLTSLLIMGLISVFLFLFLFLILNSNESDPIKSAQVSWILVLGTLIYPFLTVYYSHCFTALLLVISFYLISQKNRYLPSGLLLGIAFGSEFTALLFCPAILFYLFREKRLNAHALISLSIGFILGLIPFFTFNYLAYGEFYINPYSQFSDTKITGDLGFNLPFFSKHFWNGLKEILFKSQRGLFFLCPTTILGVFGWISAFKKKGPYPAELSFSLILFISFLIFNASYGDSIYYWGGSLSFGPRYIIPAIPFLAFPVLEFLKTSKGWIFKILGPPSLFISFMAAAINPRVPLGLSNVVSQYLWPEFISGRMAPNFGNFLGLHFMYSVMPLGLLWVAVFRILLSNGLTGFDFFKTNFKAGIR